MKNIDLYMSSAARHMTIIFAKAGFIGFMLTYILAALSAYVLMPALVMYPLPRESDTLFMSGFLTLYPIAIGIAVAAAILHGLPKMVLSRMIVSVVPAVLGCMVPFVDSAIFLSPPFVGLEILLVLTLVYIFCAVRFAPEWVKRNGI